MSHKVRHIEVAGSPNNTDEALIQQARLLELREPDPYDLRDLQHFLGNEEMMGVWALGGDDRETWGSVIEPDKRKHDLVGLRTRYREDSFSRWVADHAVVLFKCGWARFKKPKKATGAVGYYDSSVLRITFWMTSMIASLIPIASIMVLISLSDKPVTKAQRGQVGTIAAFNILISACLTVLNDAKRTEVFAVNAA